MLAVIWRMMAWISFEIVLDDFSLWTLVLMTSASVWISKAHRSKTRRDASLAMMRTTF